VLKTGPLGVNTLIIPVAGPFVFIVDPAACHTAGDERVISDWLQAHKKVPLAFVLTHGHFDHVAGLPSLCRDWPSCPVLINSFDASMIGSEGSRVQSVLLHQLGLDYLIADFMQLPSPSGFLDDEKSLAACLPAEQMSTDAVESALSQWRVIHTPGHTAGSVCLYNEQEKILITGDTIFYHSRGRTDFPGGSESLMQSSLSKMYALADPDSLVYPGHDRFGFRVSENINGYRE
jgi:hydroxyacylglutathione hydrolase